MFIRATLYLDDLDFINLKRHLKDNNLNPSISFLFRKWIRTYLTKNNYAVSTEEITNAPDKTSNKVSELRKLQEQVINKPTQTTQEATQEQEYGICPFCYIKKAKPVILVTYLDQDQVKVEGKLCNECIVKARASGNPVTKGGLNEN